MVKLEDQVCSLELAKRLKELGVKQESAFYWCDVNEENRIGPVILYGGHDEPAANLAAAFTVAELGLLLPKGYRSYYYDGHHSGGTWMCNNGENIGEADSPTEADARAKMLIYLIENNLVKP